MKVHKHDVSVGPRHEATLLDRCPSCECPDVVVVRYADEHAVFNRKTGSAGLFVRDSTIAIVDYECEKCGTSMVES